MEEVRPLGAGEHDPGLRATLALRDGGKDERVGPEGGQPLRVTVDVRELLAADVVVMKNGVDLTRHDAHAMTPKQWLGLIAPVRKEAGRAGGDRAFTHRRRFGENSLGI